MINVRQKGADGEREIANDMNAIVQETMRSMGFPEVEVTAARYGVQRNQNQTAVGGNDLTGCMGLSIEIKRQEQLAINTWWDQCVMSASRNSEVPVLLYRQNGKKWRCVTQTYVEAPNKKFVVLRAEFGYDEFLIWWRVWVRQKLAEGAEVRK